LQHGHAPCGELNEKLFGTLYYWKIRKAEEKEEFVDDKS
jgi:hypothetical protein